MARNKLAGTKKGKSESAKYFQDNPEAKAKKDAYNKKYHSSEKRKKYRTLLNKINRKKGTYGNGDGKDESHTKSGKTVQEKQSTNRARNGKGSKPKRK
jgi:hypothetical protein